MSTDDRIDETRHTLTRLLRQSGRRALRLANRDRSAGIYEQAAPLRLARWDAHCARKLLRSVRADPAANIDLLLLVDATLESAIATLTERLQELGAEIDALTIHGSPGSPLRPAEAETYAPRKGSS